MLEGLIAMAMAKYNYLIQRGKWEQKSMEEEKIVALSVEVAGLRGELKIAKNVADKADNGHKKNQKKKKKMDKKKTKNKKSKKDKKKKKKDEAWEKSHQDQRILKRRWSTRSLTIDASTTWLGLLTNLRTVDLARTKVKA